MLGVCQEIIIIHRIQIMSLQFNREALSISSNALPRKISNSVLTHLLSSSPTLSNTERNTFHNRAISQPVTSSSTSYNSINSSLYHPISPHHTTNDNTQYPLLITVFIQQIDQLHTIHIQLYSSYTVSQLLYSILQHCCAHKQILNKHSVHIPPSPLTLNHIFQLYQLCVADSNGNIDTDCPNIDMDQSVVLLNIQYYRLRAINRRHHTHSNNNSPYRAMNNIRSHSDDIMLLNINTDSLTLGQPTNYQHKSCGDQNDTAAATSLDLSPMSSIISAIESGNLHYIQHCIDNHIIDIDTIDSHTGHTVLIHSIVHKQQHIINYCIRNECNVNLSSTKNCQTPLHYACELNMVDTVELLLNNDADSSVLDSNNRKSIDCADKQNNELIELLQNV